MIIERPHGSSHGNDNRTQHGSSHYPCGAPTASELPHETYKMSLHSSAVEEHPGNLFFLYSFVSSYGVLLTSIYGFINFFSFLDRYGSFVYSFLKFLLIN